DVLEPVSRSDERLDSMPAIDVTEKLPRFGDALQSEEEIAADFEDLGCSASSDGGAARVVVEAGHFAEDASFRREHDRLSAGANDFERARLQQESSGAIVAGAAELIAGLQPPADDRILVPLAV